MNRGWRPISLVREAVRNVADRRGPLGPVLLAAIAIGSALGCFVVDRRSALDDRLAADVAAGARLVVVATPSSAGSPRTLIGRRSCEALGNAVGARSGLVVDLGSDRFDPLGSSTHVIGASPTIVRGGRAAALVGRSVLRGVGSRRIRGTRWGTVTVVALPPQPDGAELNTSLVTALDPAVTAAPACVVMLPPLARPAKLLAVIPAQLDADGSTAVAALAAPGRNSVAEYLARIERWLPSAVGLFIAALIGIVCARRQSELAAYRLSGTSRRALAALLQLESAMLAGALWASAIAALLVRGAHARDLIALATALAAAPLTALAMVPVFVAPVVRRDAFSLAKAA